MISRKAFIAVVFSLLVSTFSICAQSIYPGQHRGKIKNETTAPIKTQSFDLRDVRILPGRIHDNLKRDSAWMVSLSVNRLLHSFRNNAGVFAGLEGGYESVKKLGGWESLDCDLRGHTTGHLMSAYGLMYAATGCELFKLKGDSIIHGLMEVQQALGNGYISAFPEELINRNIKGQSVWAPWYTLHKLLAGLIDQYLYADNPNALAIAVKMGDWAHRKLIDLSEDTRRLMLRNEFGGMNEAFYNLYAVTGDSRYKKLAEFFYHNDVIDPLAEGNTDFGTKHTNTFIPKVIGEARNYELTSTERSKRIVDAFWNEMVHRHSFVTGSISQKEHFFITAKFSQYINGYTGESCCTYNMLKLSRHLFCLDASPEVADYYERALYNHILGQQDTESGMVCYFLPLLTGAYKVYSTPEHSFWCCVGSGFESHAKYGESIYFHSDNNLYINLFIPSRLTWQEKGLAISQTTDFPESDIVNVYVEEAPSDKVCIKLRYPVWSGKPEIKVNNKKISFSTTPSSYISINRRWKRGDHIEIRYPMSLHVETTPDNPKKGAILYGPIVLAGDLGNEGVTAFSDPTVRNDYYTYDYRIPQNLNGTLAVDTLNLDADIVRNPKTLTFHTSDGHILRPLYDTHRTRYAVYWDITDRKTKSKSEIFDYSFGEQGNKAYLRLPKGCKKVNALLYCHQNMTEEVLFRSKNFTSRMDSLGIAMAFIQRGSQNWDPESNCKERFEQIISEFASATGHPEILSAPIIPFGHSAQATFPWNFAAWNPERTLCIISYHGDAPRTNLCGYGRANVEWGRTRNIDRIPGLMIMGEYEWWDARVRPALAFRMMYPDSRISFLCDAGKGHFDMCEDTQMYIAAFIEKALRNPRPEGGVYLSRWSHDGSQVDNPHEQFWYQDNEMLEWTRARYAENLGKKMQYVSVKHNGKLVHYNADSHIKLNISDFNGEITLEPVYVNESRDAESSCHSAAKPRIVVISGPVIQTGPTRFRYDPDYFGFDPKRLWSGITLCVEADGDDTYKPAVQELQIML